MGTFYNSRSECVSAKRSALEKAYQKAGRYLTPDNSDCIAKAAAKYYHEHIHTIFTTPILEELEKLCELKNKSSIYQRLKEMLRQDQKSFCPSWKQSFVKTPIIIVCMNLIILWIR